MKLMDGGSLADCIADRKLYTQSPRHCAKLMSIVADAVHYGHQHGILHRDLKPANVLLDSNGDPFVTDFGLAKRIDAAFGKGNPNDQSAEWQMTASGVVVGTPSYLAPEQARGQTRNVTIATDVYGVGAMLYHLLTGRPPFEGESVVEVLREVNEKEPVRPQSLNPKIDRDLETICLKALAKEPASRYASAGALKEDLDRWLAGEPIHARPSGGWKDPSNGPVETRPSQPCWQRCPLVADRYGDGDLAVAAGGKSAANRRNPARRRRNAAAVRRRRKPQHGGLPPAWRWNEESITAQDDEIPRGVLWMAKPGNVRVG